MQRLSKSKSSLPFGLSKIASYAFLAYALQPYSFALANDANALETPVAPRRGSNATWVEQGDIGLTRPTVKMLLDEDRPPVIKVGPIDGVWVQFPVEITRCVKRASFLGYSYGDSEVKDGAVVYNSIFLYLAIANMPASQIEKIEIAKIQCKLKNSRIITLGVRPAMEDAYSVVFLEEHLDETRSVPPSKTLEKLPYIDFSEPLEDNLQPQKPTGMMAKSSKSKSKSSEKRDAIAPPTMRQFAAAGIRPFLFREKP